MDKQIKKKRFTVKKVATWGGGALLIIFIAYQFLFADRRSRLKVDMNKITISEVKRGIFQETIPQTGEVRPKNTVYLDVLEGGNIKKILKESGAMLKAGDVIMELSNFNRELSVLGQEAQFNESINRARETQVQLQRMDTEQRINLATIQQQLDILGPQYERARALYGKKLISKQDFEIAESNYILNKSKYEIQYQAYKLDSADRIRSLASTRLSEQKMIQSLDGIGQILDNLSIKTPIDGQLSFLQHWDLGQAVNTGQRLGQVDVLGEYKVRVPIDELYKPRISPGLHATTEYAGKTYGLIITYKYPDVVAGRFEVDMEFESEAPDGISRGQSLRLRIELGMSSEELLLPVGGFYKDTGGNWVFVLDNNNQAVKRDIKLGRKSPDYFEVLEGLQPGDRVITSSYENFGNNEVLILN
ncbi:MAG: HlyD family efflux transporter periplasmic adaptor subunit [Bacteroidota bacterium]